MTPEEAKALREPFPPETIGKLPKVNCKACTDANKQRFGTTCEKHEKRKCDVCENFMTTAHIHLDYVGHAAATDRLLQVDPEWTWEPAASDQYGSPIVGADGLWIKLTICGVTRYGFGDGKTVKEMIGDAIRNAAMRFGVALDLWAKEDLHAAEEAQRTRVPPADEIARIRQLATEADIGEWVKDQQFPWPWPAEACAAIEAKADEVLSAPFTPEPEPTPVEKALSQVQDLQQTLARSDQAAATDTAPL